MPENMHRTFALFGVVVLAVALTTNGQYMAGNYRGILMNGINGTQVYDPFNTPHIYGYLQLGLQTSLNAKGGAAVINGNVAYFASSSSGKRISYYRYIVLILTVQTKQ